MKRRRVGVRGASRREASRREAASVKGSGTQLLSEDDVGLRCRSIQRTTI
ncbi:MAG: hypothetical protein ACHBN1_15290 [Heteroscytonema crispum UTEX LB 1556]